MWFLMSIGFVVNCLNMIECCSDFGLSWMLLLSSCMKLFFGCCSVLCIVWVKLFELLRLG